MSAGWISRDDFLIKSTCEGNSHHYHHHHQILLSLLWEKEKGTQNGHQAKGHDILGQIITLFPSYVANANKRLSIFGFSFLRIEMDYVGLFIGSDLKGFCCLPCPGRTLF